MTKENERYKRHSIYSNRNSEKNITNLEATLTKSNLGEIEVFLVKGKPDFSDINFASYGWKRKNTISPKQREFIENTPGYKDYKETIIYEGPQGIAIVHANYQKDNHKVAIYINNPKDSHQMDIVKFMFQSEWGYILQELKNPGLIGDLEPESN